MITVFLKSLAEHWTGCLIAVIVPGYDGDGSEALCEIRDVGGITIAQKPDTAGQPDMPVSAIATGCIEYILSPEDIAARITKLTRNRETCTKSRVRRRSLAGLSSFRACDPSARPATSCAVPMPQ